jgi:predicted DNA binding CopG/RHH family protein
MSKRLPQLRTDREAEDFLESDLSNLDFTQFEKKDEQINLRVSGSLMAAVRARANARGIPYTRYIRETLERAVAATK